MKKTYNWAILGCGNIAAKFANDLTRLPNARCYAAASRNLSKAEAFANTYGFEKAFDSYESMVKDPEVDIVYIATPHNFHKAHSILCLQHQKAVLCEKAFAINTGEVKEMIACAKNNNTFLMEAFWQMFKPKFKKIQELMKLKTLGKPVFLKSDFMFNGPFDPSNRLYNIALGGGSLLDIGIYPVFTAVTLLGMPETVKSIPHFSTTGSEESISILLGYKHGATAVLTSSFNAECKNETEICFEHGSIVYNRFSSDPILLTEKGITKEIPCASGAALGYHYEADHVMECLDKGLLESPRMSFEHSLNLMKALDSIRKDAGIVFPNHD